MAIDPTAPIGPFGATVNGVSGLVPEATLRDEDTPSPEGQYRVTREAVAGWIRQVSGAAALILDGWQGLSTTPRDPEVDSDRDQFIAYVSTIVECGAASYLEAARHPERSSVNTESYSAVLWARYIDGLDRIAAWLRDKLANAGTGPDEPAGDSGGVSWSFPAPLFGDCLRL